MNNGIEGGPGPQSQPPARRGPSFHRRSDRRGSGGYHVDDGGRPVVGRGYRGRRRDRDTWPARARPDPRIGGVRAQARCAAGLDASSGAPSPQPGACSAPSQSAVATVTAAWRARKGSSSCPSGRSWCAGSRIPGESGRGGRGLPRHEVGDSPPRLLPPWPAEVSRLQVVAVVGRTGSIGPRSAMRESHASRPGATACSPEAATPFLAGPVGRHTPIRLTSPGACPGTAGRLHREHSAGALQLASFATYCA